MLFFLFVYRILKDLMTSEGFKRFWIGLNDTNHENNWYWIDGKKAIKEETNWNNVEPNNAQNNEDCAEVINNVFKFNDNNCNNKLFALCEIN